MYDCEYECAQVFARADVNEAPSAVLLSAFSVQENAQAGTTIGTLSTVDVDAGDTFTYTASPPSSFSIQGTSLRTATVFDFEATRWAIVTVTSTDAGGLFVANIFNITIVGAQVFLVCAQA
jgi:hypothetical protein